MAISFNAFNNSAPLEVMLTWPGTPDHGRLTAAASLYKNVQERLITPEQLSRIERDSPADHEDFLCYQERLGAHDFRLTAGRRYTQRRKSNRDSNILDTLMDIAQSGTGPRTTGIAVISMPPPGAPAKGTHLTAFTRLPRNSHWTGLDPVLTQLNGLNTLVLQDPNTQPPTVDIVLAFPSELTPEVDATTTFPRGEPKTLRDILIHHTPQSIKWLVT